LNYAGVSFVPTRAESAQRRVLVEQTFALRNLREEPLPAS
jgi:hypothetical protein